MQKDLGIKNTLLATYPKLPDPLKEKIKPFINQLKQSDSTLTTQDRLLKIISAIQEIDEFDAAVSVHQEILTILAGVEWTDPDEP